MTPRAPTPMHADEVRVRPDVVRSLLREQFPQWADLPVTRVRSDGTDNSIFRLGERLAVRLPRIAEAADAPAREHEWLPRLAPRLPVAIPRVLAVGSPGVGYPWPWSVYEWLPGDHPVEGSGLPPGLPEELADFVRSMRAIDPAGGPPAYRGDPVSARDAEVRAALASLGEQVDAAALLAIWADAVAAPDWDGPPCWVHGDLSAGNLVCDGRQLTAVIDFGGLGVGDPACDVLPAWLVFDAEGRRRYRQALAVDDAMWRRGRGWAVSVAVVALPYYATTNPGIVRRSFRMLAEVLADAAERA